MVVGEIGFSDRAYLLCALNGFSDEMKPAAGSGAAVYCGKFRLSRIIREFFQMF